MVVLRGFVQQCRGGGSCYCVVRVALSLLEVVRVRIIPGPAANFCKAQNEDCFRSIYRKFMIRLILPTSFTSPACRMVLGGVSTLLRRVQVSETVIAGGDQ